MNADPNDLLHWFTAMTPDKLALVLPFFIGYVIVRVRNIDTNWLWLICPLVAAALFTVLGPVSRDRSNLQNWTFNFSVGLVLGFISALLALGIHSVLFKKLADKYPLLSILVLADEEPNPNNNKTEIKS